MIVHKIKIMNIIHDSMEIGYVCGAEITEIIDFSVDSKGSSWVVQNEETTCERCLLKMEVSLI